MSGNFFLLPKLLKGVVIPADLVVYNSLLSCLCKAGLPTNAVKVYREILDRGYTPDKYSYTALLAGLCRAKKIEEAVDVYQGMVMSKFNLDAYVHTIVIDGLNKVGKYQQAIHLFKQVVEEKWFVDIVLYTVAVEGFVKGGRVVEACTLFHKIKGLGLSPNARIYNLMLSGLCKEREVNLVKHILQEMFDEGVELDSKTCKKISNLVLRTRYHFSIFDLLIKMWDLKLIADGVMHALLLEGHSRGIVVGDVCSFKTLVGKNTVAAMSRPEGYSFAETSSSEELSEMAASVG